MVICIQCSKEFKCRPCEVEKRKFCSRQCKSQYQTENKTGWHRKETKVTKSCEECHQEFQVIRARAEQARYCNKTCLGKANGKRAKEKLTKKIDVSYTYCQKPHPRKPCELKGQQWFFCSRECMTKHYAETGAFAGENNAAWQGGDIDYYGPNWREQRRKARKRDNYTCQDCGITEKEYGRELSIHHIKLFRSFDGDWQAANQLDNLASLCEYPCHRNRHSKNS